MQIFIHIHVAGNWTFRSHVLSLPWAKVPWVDLSFPGTFAPESENGVELSLPNMNYRAVKTWWL